MTYEYAIPEPFGPIYERPANPDCPDCDCCTAVLCERGRSSLWGCLLADNTDPELRKRLAECPCSNGPDSFFGEWQLLARACNRGEITEAVLDEQVGALLAKYGIPDERPEIPAEVTPMLPDGWVIDNEGLG
uniref:hypothetical protein n=1 Tax=Nonomuraea sp. CA-251285 TaxID=3240002 RepID=UPI003F49B3D6